MLPRFPIYHVAIIRLLHGDYREQEDLNKDAGGLQPRTAMAKSEGCVSTSGRSSTHSTMFVGLPFESSSASASACSAVNGK